MVDNQTVQQPYWDNPCIWLYRSGYDERTHRGLDRYGKTEEYYRRTGSAEFIQDGTRLVLDWESRTVDDIFKFFGFDCSDSASGKRTSGYHLKLCFDFYGRPILFKRDLGYTPEKFLQKSKVRTKTWKTWTPKTIQDRISLKKPDEYVTHGWLFNKPDDYLIFKPISPWKLNTLIPEYDVCSLTYDDDLHLKLWNIGIVDLSESWVTPESEKEVERIYEIRKRKGDAI